jgi:hypothetical protein
MPAVPAFHSVNEAQKPAAMREHHNNSECPTARNIPANEQRPGTGPAPGRGYQVCHDCSTRNAQGR